VSDLKKSVVTSACLQNGLFTVVAVLNNLVHNHSSTSVMDAFHGTNISIFQFPTKANPVKVRPHVTIPPIGASQHSLPDNYAFGTQLDSNGYSCTN